MADIVVFPSRQPRAARLPPMPRLHGAVRTRASLLAAGLSLLLTILGFALVMLVGAALLYDGNLVSLSPTGLCVGERACRMPGTLPLGALLPMQRDLLATGLVLLSMPALMALGHLRGLFRLYAAGIVFEPDNISQISRAGLWLLAYAAAPFLVDRLLNGAGLFPGGDWFRADEVAAVIVGLSMLLAAQVIACGREMEQRPDLFI
ncbi:hypothetical protein [Lichenicoccus roseus]|uniref:DUF2975 domain-containing protein n=1 Tax=Lichenicoccus roseus TaxID=2683649 RepID=A0A5R9JC44_9PROT|nr:hypothetical protein [Lichenicoccus roseus]TLU71858.1 hypothetical protein FE263_15515 [Lichenicoccus roseus]